MATYSKFNIIYQLQKWMDSVAGQTFLNYAYSWGASIVILGTLFKLTHLPMANFFLFLGMGTEVFVFFISAFDRPFDKTTDGMELEHESQQQGGVYSGKTSRTAPGNTYDNGLLELLNTRLSEIEKMNKRLPDGQETDQIHEVLVSIHQNYQQQFLKLSSQLVSIDKMDEKLKIQNAYLGELNKVYAKMIEAVGGRTAILTDESEDNKQVS